MLLKNPLAVAITVENWLYSYASGVVIEDSTNTCSTTVNHAVIIIGYGVYNPPVSGCTNYWVIQNSWGTGWGEKGYANFCADRATTVTTGTCMINTNVMYLTL